MAATKYYPEDELVEKFQSGEYGWIDYVNHHSPEWQEEYTAFCRERGLTINEESAVSPSMRKAQSSLSSGREIS